MHIRTITLTSAIVLVAAGAFISQQSYAACVPGSLGRAVYGESGPTVKALQECLISAGYSIPAGPTGYYGAQTQAAAKAFYAAVLGMPDWDGRSVGPQGRGKLALLTGTGGGFGVTRPVTAYKRAANADELAKYVAETDQGMSYGALSFARDVTGVESTLNDMRAGALPQSASAESAPSRVSETNVQVSGIDEPDIVKTDGQSIFISKEGWWGGVMPAQVRMSTDLAIAPPYQDTGKTIAVDAFPVDSLKVVSEKIDETGELLLVKGQDVLIVLSYPSIVAYDVKDPSSPTEKWRLKLEDSTSLLTARLTGTSLYLVTQTWLGSDVPCPVVPLMRGSSKVSIPCTDIWVPVALEPANAAYTLLTLDAVSGAVEKSVSIATDAGSATVAMFKDNLYLASRSYGAPYDVLIQSYIDAAKPYVSATTLAKINAIKGYDISASGKLSEIELAIREGWKGSGSDEQLRKETELNNALQTILSGKKRELETTRIARVSLGTAQIAAVGEVPGHLLNQFSLDEYEGNVRVAVTVGGGWGWGAGGESVNDVYVLDSTLNKIGSIQDLGVSERIYAARFIGPRGYLVTFRQVDPFYVLDLSTPTAPKLAGELKIPGYSAYLEPLEGDLVLGVGREGSGVKLSVFDVSDPAKPTERSKYTLTDTWTEVENNHRAFLRDALHEVFFIPGGNGGYVFSYTGGTLTLKATVAGWDVKRAVYIDDYLYIIGMQEIVVLDENTWKQVKELEL